MTLDLLKIYDIAVVSLLTEGGGRLLVDGKPVVTVFATPERAQLGVLKKLGLLDANGRPKDLVPYPYISIARIDSMPDWNRRNTNYARHIAYSDDLRRVAYARWPVPYNFFYQVDFWSRFRTHTNQVWQWIGLAFPTEIRILHIDFREPWGKKMVPLFIRDLRDVSELETEEDERVMRLSATFMLAGWVLEAFDDLASIPLGQFDDQAFTKRVATVWKAGFDYIEPTSGEVLGSEEIDLKQK